MLQELLEWTYLNSVSRLFQNSKKWSCGSPVQHFYKEDFILVVTLME